MAGLVVEIVRNDLANRPRGDGTEPGASLRSYLVLCERSAGQYLFDILLDAGQEFGIDVEGFGGSAGVIPIAQPGIGLTTNVLSVSRQCP